MSETSMISLIPDCLRSRTNRRPSWSLKLVNFYLFLLSIFRLGVHVRNLHEAFPEGLRTLPRGVHLVI